MTNRIDISHQLDELCDRLGLVPRNVGSLTIEPGAAVATVYRLNENGDKFVEHGKPATETHTFRVKT